MQPRLKYSFIIIGVIVGIICLSKLPSFGINSGGYSSITQWQAIMDEIQKLLFLAQQDQNPLVSLLHSTAAMSKLHTLRSMGPSNRISKILDVSLVDMHAELAGLQRERSRVINETCPGLFIMTSGAYDIDLFA